MLVSHQNVLKLADFGVCQTLDIYKDDDLVSGNDGTPLYHSPEMFDPDVYRYSGSKVDIWAAGVILYQMFTGLLPFFNKKEMTREEYAKEYDAILHKNVDYPPEVREDVLLVDLLNSELQKQYLLTFQLISDLFQIFLKRTFTSGSQLNRFANTRMTSLLLA